MNSQSIRLLMGIVLFVGCTTWSASAADRPNILWLTSEDHGPEMGCYGDPLARTPNVDALAAKGMMFKRAWSVAPVCAPARSAIISGIYPSSSGGIHMRSMVPMPNGTKMYPQILREAGYYCTNNSKTDYNLREVGRTWDESSNKAHWKNRGDNRPFFAVFNSTKSHESQIRTRPHKLITDPAKVRVPDYHPDTPEVREDWAQYYDKVSEADADAGLHLKEIAEAGLSEDTIVFYYGDHGSGMPRSKRWPSNSGLHVPMVIFFPPKWQHLAPKEYRPGGSSDRLISFVDLAPTLLSIVGIEPPNWMQGHAFAGPFQTEPQPFVYGERGRMDERMDLVRSVTDGRYVYLRNYFPHVSQAQRVAYQFETPTTRIWHDLFVAGKTTDVQSIFWQVPKASEELYDLQNDRDEVNNLAASPQHREILERLREASQQHVLAVRDVGFLPEIEIHSRSAGTTPYDMGHDPKAYPLDRILSAADLASRLGNSTTDDSIEVTALSELLNADDSALRYWGTLGIMIRGEKAVSSHQHALESLLIDQAPSVQIVAAQSLAMYGEESLRKKSLETLGLLADAKSNGVLVSMAALAAIESLGKKAASLGERISKLAPNGSSPDARYDDYVPRLLQNITDKPTPETAEPGAKRNEKKTKRANR